MIPDKIKLEILTPTAKIYSDEVTSVRLPGVKGYFGVFPGHTPFLTTLKVGEIRIRIGDEVVYFATTGGTADIQSDAVAVLADSAEPALAIDVTRAEKAKTRAQQRLAEGRTKWDVQRAQVALARAVNRLRTASHARVH
jgi:F-type H+-transporting ATPase subunit epsilon